MTTLISHIKRYCRRVFRKASLGPSLAASTQTAEVFYTSHAHEDDSVAPPSLEIPSIWVTRPSSVHALPETQAGLTAEDGSSFTETIASSYSSPFGNESGHSPLGDSPLRPTGHSLSCDENNDATGSRLAAAETVLSSNASSASAIRHSVATTYHSAIDGVVPSDDASRFPSFEVNYGSTRSDALELALLLGTLRDDLDLNTVSQEASAPSNALFVAPIISEEPEHMTVDEVAASPLFQYAFYTDEHVWHEPAAPTHEVGQPSRIQWRLPALVPPAVAAPMPSILDGLFAPPLGPEFTPDLQAAATPRQFAYLPAEDEPSGPGLAMLPVAKAQSPRVMISSSGPPELLHTQRQAGQFGPIAPPRSPGVHQDTNRQPPQAQHDLLFAKDAALRASFPRSDCQWSLHPPPGISQPYIAGGGRAYLIHTDVNAPAAFRVGPAVITLSHHRGMIGSAGSGYEAELLLNGQLFPVEVNIYWKAALRADKFMLEQVLRERRAQEILRTRGSKLITRLVSSFETSDFVCFVTDTYKTLMPDILEQDTRELGTVRVRKIAAELLFGLEQLHSLGIVHRNIGANSLVFRHDGQLAIRRLFRACQQKDQLPGCLSTAPEMLADGSVHTYQADVWDYGVLLAKLCLHGKDVFAGHKTKNDLGEILRGWNVKEDSRFQERVPHVLCDLLSELLKTDPQERITLANAKKHLFFRQIDWQDISNCAGPVPEMLTLRPRPWTACPVRVGSLLKGMSLRELVYDPAVAEPDWSEFNWSAWEQWPRL